MKLFCIICCFVPGKSREDNPGGEADIIINGQSVCLEHSGYVQGGNFSSAINTAKTTP